MLRKGRTLVAPVERLHRIIRIRIQRRFGRLDEVLFIISALELACDHVFGALDALLHIHVQRKSRHVLHREFHQFALQLCRADLKIFRDDIAFPVRILGIDRNDVVHIHRHSQVERRRLVSGHRFVIGLLPGRNAFPIPGLGVFGGTDLDFGRAVLFGERYLTYLDGRRIFTPPLAVVIVV